MHKRFLYTTLIRDVTVKYFDSCLENRCETDEVTINSGLEGFSSGAEWSNFHTSIGGSEGIGRYR
ncbi:hypothetical protein Cflav_PD1401 [Pedosphaera parvula Ellin514]|uniref:Uncharacterized protein n=1 Tax=Pedosphaera parvula (strain Ellin514) TaxID=320771 RepID=B9XPS8_PEDPL|nr:hypothetical protein Cflav_PD1401 [Pedosphaera parvula Ellin514]